MSRRLTLCADDFAQSPAISAGILELLARRRLSAASVFSLSPLWPSLAGELSQPANHADIGLHCNLTHPFDDDTRPLGHWLLCSQLRLLSRRQLRDELLRQIDAFADALGRLPDYLDGHQHVHALPVVREALLDAVALRCAGADGPSPTCARLTSSAIWGIVGPKGSYSSYCAPASPIRPAGTAWRRRPGSAACIRYQRKRISPA